jgi:hypothetical protein
MRNRHLAAVLALSVNALLLGALTLAGRADAEPSASTPPAQAAVSNETIKAPAPEKVPNEAPKKRKSLLRKVLPVRDFGGY